MEFVNREALRREMYIKDITSVRLAESLGITRQALCKKIKGTREFKERELVILQNIFGTCIFFGRTRCQNGNRRKEKKNED